MELNNKYTDIIKLNFNDSYTTISYINKHFNNLIESGIEVTCKGWIQSCRIQSTNLFVQIYDGSIGNNLQVIFLDFDKNEFSNLPSGTTVEISGVIVKSPAKGQEYEMQGNFITILGKINDPSTYLPCVKGIKLENLRNKAHMRTKFQSMRAIYRVRSCVLQGLHHYFKKVGCFQLDPNVITTSDCEGAGEVFTITTQFNNLNSSKKLDVDFNKDFFRKQAFLTVSSQLQLEALCSGMGKVYTMNPSFRAEPSQTNRHVACFTHVEWELAFINLKQLLDFNEDIVKYAISYVLDNCMDDLLTLDKFISKGIINKLITTISEPFERITYSQALDILSMPEHFNELLQKYKDFELPKWGDDLGSNCERYLSEVVFKKPVLVFNYPKVLKSFYMKQNEDDNEKRTVQSCDLLMPGIGEVIGSSIREDDYDKLLSVMQEKNMNVEPLQWYVNLRKDATFPHGGAGLGVDRLIAYCTFLEGSIRDVIPFPVAYEMCDY
jgi:asparaginyl-tRNA synthetase